MKTTANYSTYPGIGRFAALKRSVKSIINQVDQVYIYWNLTQWGLIPKWFKDNHKIINLVGENLTDNGKFYPLKFRQDCIYLSCDDDLLYPKGYADFMAEQAKAYTVVSLHGRRIQLDQDWQTSYYYGGHLVYSYLNDVDRIQKVDIIGTGVAAFNTKKFRPESIVHDPRHKMSDLLFSLEAAKQDRAMYVLPHKGAWVKPIRMESSIYSETYRGDQTEHVKIVKEIVNLK